MQLFCNFAGRPAGGRFFRQIRSHEGRVEIVAAAEVLDGIGVGLSEDPFADEIVDHLAEILAAAHAPIAEDRRHHGAVFLQRILADALEQLLAGDVVAAFLGLFALLYGVVERVAEEEIRFSIVARILFNDQIEFFTEFEFLHRWNGRRELFGQTGAGAGGTCAYTHVQSVKKIHTPKLRAESKHVAHRRQLLALAGVLLLGASSLPAAPPVAPRAETPQGELHAAQLMAVALFARQAGQDELQKLDRIFADLEAKYPRDAAMANGHAEFLWNIGDHDRAVKTWLAAEKLDPNNATVLDHLGGCSFAAGEVKKAAGYYARAASNAPDNAAYHFSYANVAFLFRHELHDATHPDSESLLVEALQHFGEAARLEPLNADYVRAFAETFYSLEKPDWQEALKAWQHLSDISPEKDFALLNIARVQMKLGHKPEARASLAQVQDPHYARLKARLSERIETE